MLKKNIVIILFAFVGFSLLLSPAIFAQQTDNGGLTGTVTDSNGGLVPNATVTVTNLGTNAKRTLTTNEEGRWTIAVLPLGNYEVTSVAEGFELVKQTVTVVTSQTTTVDLILGLAGTGAVVNIDITEGGEDQIRTDSPVTGISITGQVLEQSPVPNRSAFGRLNVATEVSGDNGNPATNDNGNPEISVNGSRTTGQGVQFNGIDATNFSGTGSLTESISPAQETVQEVKLLSSLYDASLGRNGGGSVQVVTRSGTNAFSGSAYIFAQNEKFNSNDFFFNRDGIDRQKARRLEGGFTLGGPVIKDRLWFFGGYQKTDATTAYVPTAQSFVVLPLALAFINDRSNPESVRQAFVFAQLQGGRSSSFRNGPQCIQNLSPTSTASAITVTCIDPNSPGFRLLNLRNPATGDFFIPTLRQGRFEQLFYNSNNVRVLRNGITRITDFTPFGLPNGLPIIDFCTGQNTVKK